MPISVTCPACHESQTVGDDKAGLRFRCPRCGEIASIPSRSETASMRIEGGKISPSSRSVRPKHGLPRLRPLIYGCVGLLVVFSLAFRWWFNPPAQKPLTPVANQKSGASQPSASATVNSASVPGMKTPEIVKSSPQSDKLRSALNEARAELVRNKMSQQFVTGLQSVASDIPEIQLSFDPGKVVWNRFQLYEHGIHLNAFRFTSPLDVDGDFYWCFATPSDIGNWYILPASGSMEGFSDYQALTDLELEGLDMPRSVSVIAQQLIGGKIKAHQTYIVYFNSRSMGELPFRVAARIVPTGQQYDRENRAARIFRKLGIVTLPKVEPTPGSRVLTGHADSIVELTWRPHGELVSFDSDGNVYTWDVRSATLISKVPTGHKIVKAALSSDGTRALLLSQSPPLVGVWNLDTGELEQTMPAHKGVPKCSCFALDGNSVYVVYQQTPTTANNVEVVQWSIERQEIVASRTDQGVDFRRLESTPGGLRVFGGVGADQLNLSPAIAVWPADLSSGPEIAKSAGHLTMSACRVQKAQHDLSVDFYGIIKLYEQSRADKPVYSCALPNRMSDVCCLADDRFVAIACYENVVHLFDTLNRRICMTWAGHEDCVVQVRISSDGKTLASSSKDGTIRLWDPSQRSHPQFDLKAIVDSQGHDLKPIPADTFVMGTSPGILYNHAYRAMEQFVQWEQPQHRVRISRPYYLGSHEVTVGQFRKFVDATQYVTTGEKNGRGGTTIDIENLRQVQKPEWTWRNPGYETTEDSPVAQISWDDAQAYCAWLSKLENATYRLPTEAEWEFACGASEERQSSFLVTNKMLELCTNTADASLRAVYGNRYSVAGSWNDGHVYAAPVGTYLPNEYGLSEMLGNVWELCQDTWTDHYATPTTPDEVVVDPVSREGTLHVCRGASFFCNHQDARAGRRDNVKPDEIQSDVGFRVLREIAGPISK